MRIGRAIAAHFVAVLLSSLLLFVGVEAVVFGSVGVLQGVGKWIGGVLIFIVLAIASLPIGLLLRGIIGKLAPSAFSGAIVGGVFVSLALMFLLHPAMYPGVSFWTHPVALTLVHGFAGFCGGALWHTVEFGLGGEHFG